MTDPTEIDRLFVYGTLRSGDVRWTMLEPFVIDAGRDDRVPGWLYDTGLGYPAAIFHGTGHRDAPAGDAGAAVDPPMVRGTTFALLGAAIPQALDVLDLEEDTVEGLYRRVAVVTERGVRAWAYEYGAGLDLVTIESGDWFEWRKR